MTRRSACRSFAAAAAAVVRAGRPWLLAGGIVALLLARPASAADDSKIIYPSGTTRTEAPAGAVAPSANSVTLILGLALAAVGGWMVWRNRRGPAIGRELRRLNIEETRSLGNRQYLVVAAYEGKKFLLGVCPGSINLLTALPKAGEDEDSDA